jgi:hypothetical protein
VGPSDALIVISFAVCVVGLWINRSKVFGVVTARVVAVRERIESAQKRKVDALTALRVERERPIRAEMAAIADSSALEVNNISSAAALDVAALKQVEADRTDVLVKRRTEALLAAQREELVELATKVAAELLHRDRDTLREVHVIRRLLKKVG